MKLFFLFSIIIFLSNYSLSQDYFRQSVNYKISAELFPQSKNIKLTSILNYTNNSSDELKEIFIRLHWNIFAKDSYGRRLQREQKSYYGLSTKGVNLQGVVLKQNNKVSKDAYTLDNTILKIPLIEPLKKGDSVTIEITLDEEIPPEGIRMGYYKRDFSIAHWFPAVCVYDRYGWHTDQYLGTGEFYEEIGDYEVSITLPKSYLVFYTGSLMNPDEVLPLEVRKRLDSAMNTNQTVRIFDQTEFPAERNDSIVQTWKMSAKNVRTFAFAAFENYIWDAANWNGVLVHTVYPKKLEEYYQTEGMRASIHALKFFSEYFGNYPYPQMFVTVGGTGGGMEYPGIIFMGRNFGGGILSKITSGIIIHEIGHNWFPMIINSNETEFAFLDEGFVSFATILALEDLYGRYDNTFPDGFLKKIISDVDRRTEAQASAINWSLNGYEEPIMTHADRYEQTYAFGVNSYQKSASILFMLQYVMGDSAFSDLMKEYYNRFLFKHVYPEDFFNLAMEINYKWNGKRDLRWFFDQWFTKTVKCDYALTNFSTEQRNGKYFTTITVERKEQALMPIDVVIDFENGEKKQVWFEVESFMNGPSKVSKTFEFDSKPKYAVINPDNRLMDINRMNNSTSLLPPVYFHFNHLINLPNLPYHYRILWWTPIGFNNIDGVKLGINLNGSYIGNRKSFDITIMQGMKFQKNSFGGDITIGNRLDFLGRLAFGSLKYFNYEGRRGGSIEISKSFAKVFNRNPQFRMEFTANYFDAYDDRYFDSKDFDEIEDGYFLQKQRKYVTSTISFSHNDNGEFWRLRNSISYQSGFVKQEDFYGISHPDYFEILIPGTKRNFVFQKVTVSLLQKINPSFLFNFRLREYFGYSPAKLPNAVGFYIATVNPIAEFDLPIYRTEGVISEKTRNNRSVPNGGGYMRGYYNQYIYGKIITTVNTEVEFGKLIGYIPFVGSVFSALRPTFFFDVGNVWEALRDISSDKMLTDYGFCLSLPLYTDVLSVGGINFLSPLEKIGIQEIRFDFPIFVSHPMNGENKLKFRWLIGFQSPLN